MSTAARLFLQHHVQSLPYMGYATGPWPCCPDARFGRTRLLRGPDLSSSINVFHNSLYHSDNQQFPFIYVIFFLSLHLQKTVLSLQLCYTKWPTLLVIPCKHHPLFQSSSEFCSFSKTDDGNWLRLSRQRFSSSLYGGRSTSPSLLEISCLINRMISFGFCVWL